jgi:pimeloyl-ACP methyl ester carboxylesterase
MAPSRPRNWLLLRGLIREARHWNGFDAQLAARLDGGRALCLDLPGVGTERHRPCPPSIPEIVDDLRARFLVERSDGDWGLLAASLGGMVALDWGSRYPDDFVRIAVSNTSARDLSSLTERLSPFAMRTMARALFAGDRVAREGEILGLVANSDAGRAMAPAFAALADEAPVSRATLVRQLVAGARSKAPARLGVPLLVLCSDADRMVSSECSKRIAARYGADLRVHTAAGHDLPLDDPSWVIDQLTA